MTDSPLPGLRKPAHLTGTLAPPRGVLALIIINKAGGLIYNRTFGEGLNQLTTNDYLVLAGTFHGFVFLFPHSSRLVSGLTATTPSTHSVHAITARLNPLREHHAAHYQTQQHHLQQQHEAGSGLPPPPGRPDPPSGIEVMETENFRLQCFNTQTGTKFLLFTDTMQANVDLAMRRVYELYADYVMKNPFYQLEMPVRCEMFDRKLLSYIREINNAR